MATTAAQIIAAGGVNVYYYHAIQQSSPLSVAPALTTLFPEANIDAINEAIAFARESRKAGTILNRPNRRAALEDSAVPSISAINDQPTPAMCFEARIDMRYESGPGEDRPTEYYTTVVAASYSMTPQEIYAAGAVALGKEFGTGQDRYSQKTIELLGGDIIYAWNAC